MTSPNGALRADIARLLAYGWSWPVVAHVANYLNGTSYSVERLAQIAAVPLPPALLPAYARIDRQL